MVFDRSNPERLDKLSTLLALPHETEWLEFKEAKNSYDFDKLGQYFSALSNEARLKNRPCGWLIFGVRDDHTVCGTSFRPNPSKLNGLKQEVANHTGNITFEEIHEVIHPDGRVLMFRIPPALGIPTNWKGFPYGRNGESLVALHLSKSDAIRSSQPENIGQAFSKPIEYYFDRAWYNDRLNEAISTAGPRYTPEIHVDLPIARDLELFGRTKTAVDAIKSMALDVKRGFRNVSLSREEEEELRGNVDLGALLKSRDTVLGAFASLKPEPIGELPIAKVVENIEAALSECDKLEEPLEKQSREHDSQQPKTDDRSPYRTNPYRDVLHRVKPLRYRLREARDSLKHADKIVNGNVMILRGDAGTGKTHLLCDVASSRAEDGAPTVLLMGQQFTDSTEPWTQALQHLDMRDANADQFIGAMGASAQAANRRALLIIDAVNEGRGREIWPPNMTAFLTRVEKSPWIGVIFSVRSSYEESVIPDDVRKRAVSVTHTGFQGHEYDAVRIFSEHYGIEFPSTPILHPEFQNPLLLKIIFEGLKSKGERRFPRGFSGVSETFNLYLTAVNDRLARNLDYNPKDNLVRRSLEKVAERMLEIEPEMRWLTRQRAEELVNELLPGRGFSASLYRGLIVEGVLVEDMAWRDAEPDEIVRFAYERFSDHIIADFLLRKHLDPNNLEAAFEEGGGLAFISDKSTYTPAGILEAMCVQVPELTGQELVRLAPSLLDDTWRIEDAFLQSIIWRKPDAFSDDTRKVLDELLVEGAIHYVFDTLLTVATIPGHYFNADALDMTLQGCAMPDRDVWWSVYLHNAWQNDRGPVHRLIDWASGISADDKIEDEVVDLSATALAWIFSTPNRFLRDKATKALVALLTGRIDATVRMLNRFDDVDDLYIRERVYAVAYGVAMRSQEAVEIAKLGHAVYENIFASGNPPAHILLRDYARGVVERALHLNENMAIDEKLLRPPYNRDWPPIPDDDEIDRLTPHWKDGMGRWRRGTREWARNRIRWSTTDDDFAYYVIGTNSSSISSRWLSLRLDEDRWQSPDARLQALHKNMNDSEWQGRFKSWRRSLPAFLHKNMNESEWQAQSEDFPGFDLSVVQRYIIWRVFDLGWTVKRFGDFDSITIGYQGRGATKAERMGKKYQWIAYHEILAYMADNYQYSSEYKGNGEVFQGAWQKSYRDIDPSGLLASKPGGPSWYAHPMSWWAQSNYDDWNEDASDQAWLDADGDFPRIEQFLRAVHPVDETKWLIADGSFNWEQSHPADIGPYYNPRRKLSVGCQAYFIRADDADKFKEWAKGVDFWGRWMPEPLEVYSSTAFIGEYTWSPAFKHFINSPDSAYDSEGWRDASNKCPVPLMPAAFYYTAEGRGFDCSIDDRYSLTLPSENVVKNLGLKWTGRGADFIDKQGRVAAFDPTAYEDGADALLIREDILKWFLKENDLALCWTIVGEKMVVGASDRHLRSLKFRKLTGACILTEEGIKRIHQRSSYWGDSEDE